MPNQRAVAIIIKDKKILLMRRVKNGQEYFVFPGGGVEDGESLENALGREIKEEFGLDITIEKQLFEIETQGRQECYFLVKEFSGVQILGGEEKERMGEQDQYYPEWKNLEELPRMENLYPSEARKKVGIIVKENFSTRFAARRAGSKNIHTKKYRSWIKIVIWLPIIAALVIAAISGLQKIQESFIEEVTFETPDETTPAEKVQSDKFMPYPAPDFTLREAGAGGVTSVHLYATRGQPVVLLFFASWNELSVEALRMLDHVYPRLRVAGVAVYAIDNLESPESATILRQRGQFHIPLLMDDQGEAGEAYHLSTLPVFVFVDAEGILAEDHIGILSEEDLLIKSLRLRE